MRAKLLFACVILIGCQNNELTLPENLNKILITETLDLRNTTGVTIEGKTFDGQNTAILADGAKRLTVRNCTFINIEKFAIRALNSARLYVHDNDMEGIKPGVGAGILATGTHGRIARNNIKGFWDGIALNKETYYFKIYQNTISDCVDDAYSLDFSTHTHNKVQCCRWYYR